GFCTPAHACVRRNMRTHLHVPRTSCPRRVIDAATRWWCQSCMPSSPREAWTTDRRSADCTAYGVETARQSPVSGRPARPSGLQAKRADRADNDDPSGWLYELRWEPSTPSGSPAPLQPGRRWLIFADEAGAASILVRQLRAAGQRCVVVRAGETYTWPDGQSV